MMFLRVDGLLSKIQMRNRFLSKSNSAPIVAIFLLGVVWGNSSVAGEYYYSMTGSAARYPSPYAACGSWVGYHGYLKVLSTKFHGENDPRYGCEFLYDFMYGVSPGEPQNIKPWWQEYIINRFGDSCGAGKVYDPVVGECVSNMDKGPAQPLACIGNPINIANGNKYQAEADYQNNGASTLKFTRTYNSLDGLWRHSFSTHLRIAQDAQSIALVMAHGRESFFTVSGNSVAANSADIGVLSKTATGWQFLSADNERFTFDSVGKLTTWSNASGGRQEFVYNGNQVSVSDHLGNNLTFTEDDKHQPLTLTAPGVQITYGYSSNNRLIAVNKTMGGQTTQRQFHYEDIRNTALLTGITDERGVRYATWSYDDQGRAVSSEHANGAERITIDYGSDGSASVTNALGKVANYQFQTIQGIKRITAIEGEPSANCPNSNSTFTYDSRGLLKTKTDNKGHLTTFDYNESGLEVSRTEAAGTPQARTVTTDWHPTLFLPITVTEPSRITHYTYDDQGRQLSQTQTDR